MFGTIQKYEDNKIYVSNTNGVADTNYVGYHVVFPEEEHKTIGEIIGIDKDIITIQLIGDIVDNKFNNGVLKKPSMKTTPRLIFKSELELLLGVQNYQQKGVLLLGTSPIYNDYLVTTSLNSFFSNHFAIIGNTGSGKSCGVARLLQNLFYANTKDIPKNARILLFDVYGEYYNAFDGMNKINGLNFKKLTTQQVFGNSDLLQIPAYYLDACDLAVLLNAETPSQMNILKNTIKLVRIFKATDSNIQIYQENILAKTLIDILTSNNTTGQIKEQVLAILNAFNTPSINIDTMIHQQGYDRTIKQCLEVDEEGKIGSLNLMIEFFQSKLKSDMVEISSESEIVYNLQDIYNALEFAIIKYGNQESEDSVLKNRLKNIINSDNAKFFEVGNYINKKDYIEEFFKTSNGLDNAQLVDINISYLDDEFAKSIIKIMSKLFYSYTTKLEKKGSYPIHIILEEAHRYVNHDNDSNLLGYNIFDRIIKEGSKYGIFLGLISQRPNEISKSTLMLCSNFIVFKLFFAEDLKTIKDISLNVNEDSINKITTLRPGMALIFGKAFQIPVLVNFPLPDPLPSTTSIRIESAWYDEPVNVEEAGEQEITRLNKDNFVSTIDQEEAPLENPQTEENENTTI